MKHILSTALAALAAVAGPALAHEGHGMPDAFHWHATDTLGYVVLAAVAAAALWHVRRK